MKLSFDTSVGPATVAWDAPESPRSLLVLGHGAGGGVDAADLLAVRKAALAAGHAVARLTQPYRVAGRRAPAPAPALDKAFTEVVGELRERLDVPLIVGGRSSGARVACRCAASVSAAGVLALSFPLHPPGRPDRSRADELRPVPVPVLIVQGERDTFGGPDEVNDPPLPANFAIYRVAGANHGFAVRKGDPSPLPGISAAVVEWLDKIL